MRAILFLLFSFTLAAANAQSNVASITPNSAYQGETLTVTIMGTGPFSSGTVTYADVLLTQGSATAIYTSGSGATVIAPNQISADFDISIFDLTGWYNVDVYTYGSGSSTFNTLIDGFYVNANLGGNGTIGGNVSQGSPKAGPGDPVDDLLLYLLTATGDTLRTHTNAAGDYVFKYLPTGTYELHGAGLNNSDPIEITLTGAIPSLTAQNIVLQDGKLVSAIDELILEGGVFALTPRAFSGATAINYSLKENAQVVLNIYTIDGRQVASINQGNEQAGTHRIEVNAAKFGAQGVYLFELTIDGQPYIQRGVKLQ